ncbi:MAG TPA: c(7)-type cytochrome triheme domain-containing protein [Desulfuromonadales bacterium]|nr:c(7)-type cytochrome triheme domain-containing protein [Desulfuromonadales bacterium]
MMRTFAVSMLILLVAVSLALAVPPGKTLEFSDSSMGKVIFDGKIHQQAGNSCKDCHNQEAFPAMKQGTVKITMEEIYAGRYCGVCHNGERAFDAKANCMRCHVKE